MALITKLVRSSNTPQNQTQVVADYNYNKDLFRVGTYKQRDKGRKEGATQVIELDKKMARELKERLCEFLNQ